MLFKKKSVYVTFTQTFPKKNPFTLRLRTRTSVRKRKVYGIRLRIPESDWDPPWPEAVKEKFWNAWSYGRIITYCSDDTYTQASWRRFSTDLKGILYVDPLFHYQEDRVSIREGICAEYNLTTILAGKWHIVVIQVL